MGTEITITLGGFVAFCGAIATIGAGIAVIISLIKKLREPNEIQNEQINANKTAIADHAKMLANDKKAIDAMQEEYRILCQGMLALLAHGIDGNNIKQMKEAEEALKKHLIYK